MNEKDSNTTDPDTNASAPESSEPGRWVADPDDPEWEVWEPATAEAGEAEAGEVETPKVDAGEIEKMAVITRNGYRESTTTPEAAAKWDAMLEDNDAVRCVAHKKSGERCRRLAIKGATVCRVHGGASGHVKRAARVRLEMAADRMAKELLKIAVSDDAPEHVKLAAIKDALDRAGLGAKTAVEVEVGPNKPFQEVLEAIMSGGSRAESRAARGVTDDPSGDDAGNADWIGEELDVVDAEIVDDAPPPSAPAPNAARPDPAPTPPPTVTSSGLMPMEDALAQLHSAAPPTTPPATRRNRR